MLKKFTFPLQILLFFFPLLISPLSLQAINIFIYLGAMILVQGIAMPLSMLNLDVLYSRLLGQIKQGTMQGLFVAIGDCLNLGGPILMTSISILILPQIYFISFQFPLSIQRASTNLVHRNWRIHNWNLHLAELLRKIEVKIMDLD